MLNNARRRIWDQPRVSRYFDVATADIRRLENGSPCRPSSKKVVKRIHQTGSILACVQFQHS
jgi:hypothetical protein